MHTWKAKLKKSLITKLKKSEGERLFKKYQHTFPAGYIEDFSVSIAFKDINLLENLNSENTLDLKLYIAPTTKKIHLRLYQWHSPIPLSDVLPMLENFNLRTKEERRYKINLSKTRDVWINDFLLEYKQDGFNFKKSKKLFETAFEKVYFGEAEDDGFNKLIIGATLSWREVIIFRVYAKYLHQIRFGYTQFYIERTLIKNTDITRDLINYFYALNQPDNSKNPKNIRKKILEKLEKVPDLDEDLILRKILELIKATLRTNYFQYTEDNTPKGYISIKFNSKKITDLPLPKPLYETYVYSSEFEGIHLRSSRIARGGLRWSDRLEDYRTEALGLMKAQVVKNSVIVPSGAKGCFVIKNTASLHNREEVQAKLKECYVMFIKGMLDLTDNIVNDKNIPPKDVVCHDSTDSYLVVAADKGTATFSDLANSISLEYDFWLKDAFASGGSSGYDHKKMGITARGAWESIKRHFRVLDINIENTIISAVGIGDMGGDVFGNGLLYTKNIKLIAAFDHRSIFIDPDPDPVKSYNERKRLFHLSTSSWEDYKGISKGGGVFKRSLKSIKITPQMKQVLDISHDSLPPNELIKAILRAPVDLLFNGGIGTYVKSSSETNSDVGDKINDALRVDGGELSCRVVGEGGNLGFTQKGRIEYALQGGLINTDFIDNSAGVDCSDHEVNLKILLNEVMTEGKLNLNSRDKLLRSLTKEIASLVLEDNYYQALALSFADFSAKEDLSNHADYIRMLSLQKILHRKVEYLPTDKEIVERKVLGAGLTMPELAVLIAYTKINLKSEILKSNLPEDKSVQQLLENAFPELIRKKYHKQMYNHKLKRYIIATQLANDIVNHTGINFVYQTQMETGASVEEIIRSYYIVSHIFDTNVLQRIVEEFDFKISLAEQFGIITNLHNLVKLSIRWFLQENIIKGDLKTVIEKYTTYIKTLEEIIPDLMGGETKSYLNALTEKFLKSGLPKKIARKIATYRAIYTSLNIIKVATMNDFDIIKTAKIYFASGEELNLLWFRDQISNDHREGHWNVMARLALRNELDTAQRALTVAILRSTPEKLTTMKRIEHWKTHNKSIMNRWGNITAMLHETDNTDYSMFFIVVREFIRLLQSHNHSN